MRLRRRGFAVWAGPLLALALALSTWHAASAAPENNARLTTIAKPKPPKSQTQPKGTNQGLMCNATTSCNELVNTSCLQDPRDGKFRCLCGDRSAPENALCKNKHRIVRFPCKMDSECTENAVCILPTNITNSTDYTSDMSVTHLSPTTKICWCREGYHLTDDLDHCSNSSWLILQSFVLFILSICTLLLNK